MTTLAISSADAARLFAALDDPDETAWLLIARVAVADTLLLGRQLIDVPASAYLERTPRTMRIASSGFVGAFSSAMRDGGIAVFIHTHPGGRPHPSDRDAEVDRLLLEHAEARGLTGYANVIVGGTVTAPSFSGSLYLDGRREAIQFLRVTGPDVRVLVNDDADRVEDAPAVFDRQVRAFGNAGQRLLQSLRVGVVGAGGTGSATIEQLARLGVGELVVVDDDLVDDTNVTRIHESTTSDVGESKAKLAKARCEAFGTGTKVKALEGNVASRSAIMELARCQVVFGCTDDNAGRLILNRLAYYYMVPVIDMAVIVDVDQTVGVRGVVGRVTLVAPGVPCLLCRGQVDATLAGEEMMDPETRRARAGEGYASAEAGPAPAVVAFTTAVAALASSEFLGRLFGYMDSPSSQLLVRFHDQAISRGGRPAVEGHMCTISDQWGLGDAEPLLGMVGIA